MIHILFSLTDSFIDNAEYWFNSLYHPKTDWAIKTCETFTLDVRKDDANCIIPHIPSRLYCYRKNVYYKSSYVEVERIEEMDEEGQLAMFKQIEKENGILLVVGGDDNSLLKRIFIERHLNTEGFIENSVYFTRQKAEYKGFTFNYVINYNL